MSARSAPAGSSERSERTIALVVIALVIFIVAALRIHARARPHRSTAPAQRPTYCYELDDLTSGASLYIMDAKPVDFHRLAEAVGCPQCSASTALPPIPLLSKIVAYRENGILGVEVRGAADDRLAKLCGMRHPSPRLPGAGRILDDYGKGVGVRAR